MSNVIQVNNSTGVTVERDYTPQEAAQAEIDRLAAEAAAQAAADKAAADATATAAAIAHAKSLGFTDSMIAVMYPNLGGNND